MNISFFDILRHDVQFGIAGYYAAIEDHPTEKQKKIISDILKPSIEKGKIDTSAINLFYILFASLRIIKRKSSHSYKLEKVAKLNAIPVSEIIQIATIMEKRKSDFLNITKDSIKVVKFSFYNGKTIVMKGSMTDFLFEMVFAMLTRMDDSRLVNIPIELDGFLHFRRQYQRILSKGKRGYNKGETFTKKEFDNYTMKKACKDLHNFFYKYTSLIPHGQKTANEELRIIQQFLSLSDYNADLEINTIRNYIIR